MAQYLKKHQGSANRRQQEKNPRLVLKTLKVVPYHCHHTLPAMWEALNTINHSMYCTICDTDNLLAHMALVNDYRDRWLLSTG